MATATATATATVVESERPADFMARATLGHCGATTAWVRGDCDESGQRGALLENSRRRRPFSELSWHAAVMECLTLCSKCARCRYVSLAPRWNDCSWYHSCDLNRTQISVPGFVSARYRGPPARGHNAPSDLVVAHTVNFQDAIDSQYGATTPRGVAAHSRDAARSWACDRGGPPAMAPPMVEVTRWAGDGFGYQVESAYFALRRAACCGAFARLPDNSDQQRESRHATLERVVGRRRPEAICFNFTSLMPRAAESSKARGCAEARSDDSSIFFHDRDEKHNPFGHPCAGTTATAHAARPAMQALVEYLDLEPRREVCAAQSAHHGVDWANTLVAHVRGGDIFGYCRDGSACRNLVHPYYGQPSLVYYLSALQASGRRHLLVLSEDASSPLTKLLAMAERFLAPAGRLSVSYGRPFGEDLSALLCAEHLVVSHSSLLRVVLSSRRLRTVYSYAELDPRRESGRKALFDGTGWLGSCDTRVLVAHEYVREPRWRNSDSQLLAMLTDAWNGSYRFVAQPRTYCLGLRRDGAPNYTSADA